MFFGLLLVLGTRLLQLSDLLLHVLEMLVKLVDQLGVLLLLCHDLFRLLLDVVSVDSHKTLHLVSIILLLHSLLNGSHEVLNVALPLLRSDLGSLSLMLQSDDPLLFLVHILLHLQQTLRLHIKQFLEIMQILLQAFNLLLFGLETGLHLECSMCQHLLSLLEILDLELLLEKFILFLLQVLSRILLSLVKILDLPLIILTLPLMLQSDMLDCLCLLLQLGDLSSDLVFVVFLTLDHVLLLRDLL